MKLLEYQAKEVLEKYGIPTMAGAVIEDGTDVALAARQAGLSYPVAIKAQVQGGGRGKAGGIKFANNLKEAEQACKEMLGMDIHGMQAEQLMIMEKAYPAQEWYVSILFDRFSKAPLLIFSPNGGTDIELTARKTPQKVVKIPLDPNRGVQDYTIDYAMDSTGADKKYRAQLKDIIEKLFRAFFGHHAMLVEINPLMIGEDGGMVALDSKMQIDNNALEYLPDVLAYHKEVHEDPLVKEARAYSFLYVPMEQEGNIGIISNGSGMMMSCIDLISERGMQVGAALDLGGGAAADRIEQAVRIVLSGAHIDTLFICVFGGITRCDEVANGTVAAMKLPVAQDKKLIMRLEGTNREEAAAIVRESGMPIQMVDSIPKAVEFISVLKQGGE